ncbi:MAG: glycoside hydrolase family 9 protein [Anaerolineae bacterium]|nr:glycoside hydrolase family 9 protein [Anaerolineae bacterium]
MHNVRLWVVWVCLMLALPVMAQAPLAPEELTGQAVYVPFPVAIVADGDLSDWAGVPFQTVQRGTQPSTVPGENDSFEFALAADAETLYVTMTMNDKNIVTGQHGQNYWNEDSLEFYLNFTGDFGRDSYADGVYQININPGDIGKPAGAPLTLTGTNSATLDVAGVVFATEAGWGFELAVPLSNPPTHAYEFGFQAHANGATTLDRDVKLIWSVNDPTCRNPRRWSSWFPNASSSRSTKSVICPTRPSGRCMPVARRWRVGVIGSSARRPAASRCWLATACPRIPATPTADPASGDWVYRMDFSALTAPGTYVLEVDGVLSAPFTVGTDVYAPLAVDALRYFYRTRSGIELLPEYAGADYARAAGHLSDADVTCWAGQANGQTFAPCEYRLNAVGGWYDAGDYGKYVVNGGIAVWTLHNLYERMPDQYPDGAVGLPESGAGVPDILSEARWEVDWLVRMQVPDGQPQAGMVHHKLHETVWSGLPLMPETEVDNDDPTHGRFLMPPSTAATLNMAASAAQAARLWQAFDAEWSAQVLAAAERAWLAANENPVFTYGNIPGAGGGNYDDARTEDEFFWAAAELYLTTGKAAYREFLLASPFLTDRPAVDGGRIAPMDWGNVEALGALSLLSVENDLPAEALDKLRAEVIAAADRYLTVMANEGYGVSLTLDGYVWGSNSSVLNNAIILAVAHDLSGDARHLAGVTESMDYILGRNANGISYVTGYGATPMQNPHHRFWANQPENGYPAPPAGVVSGGPNGAPSDPIAMEKVSGNPPARRYIDHIDSYSTNEVTINWNAPLAWVAAYLAR